MEESGDASINCDLAPEPSAAMIAIMVISMIFTIASAAKTLMRSGTRPAVPPYDTFGQNPTEMLDLRLPYEN